MPYARASRSVKKYLNYNNGFNRALSGLDIRSW
ncbi:hypothetical protein MCEME20_00625 [Candidatus Pelagibacterales bacterium]